jgi:seryl-tRNA synthetase
MLDIRFIKENQEKVRAALKIKNVTFDFDAFLALDEKRRDLIQKTDALRSQQNATNEEIVKIKKAKGDASAKIAEMKEISDRIKRLEEEFAPVKAEFENQLHYIPNIPHETAPWGGPEANAVVRTWGELPKFGFKPKDHIELSEKIGMMDFKCSAKIAGSGFSLYKDVGAKLERALINFMLDLHTAEHGYLEMSPPFMVNRATMTCTGQLPKFEQDMYHVEGEDLYLIPTAEVPVTNILREVTVEESDLPIKFCAYTPCFRKEAGSYGKDTRGLMRLHQFDKVELVKFVKPEESYEELEKLVKEACKVLELLNIPYRVLALAAGDMSFSAAKCYDLEIYAAGLDRWLEVSSCSNFEDFQARRGDIRFRRNGKRELVHTLNGSGTALARLVICIIENYQNEDGSISVPPVLRKYLNGQETIRAKH